MKKTIILFLALIATAIVTMAQGTDQTFEVQILLKNGIRFSDGTVLTTAPTGSGSVTWASVTGKPTFATVATTGSYTDLLNRPTLFDGTWVSLTGKPTTFAPAAHNQAWSTITGTPTTIAGYGITNAMLTTHAANAITSANITNWNTAFGWGNHAGLYKPVAYVPTWTEITGKPAEEDLSTAIPALPGIQVPRMTTVQITALTSVQEGTMVYDLTLHVMKFWNGTVWKTIITNQ